MSAQQRRPQQQGPVAAPTPAQAPARSPVPSALNAGKADQGGGGFWGSAWNAADKVTGAFSSGLDAAYGSGSMMGKAFDAPGLWGQAGKIAGPLGAGFSVINGIMGVGDEKKSGTERVKDGVGLAKGALELGATPWGEKAIEKAAPVAGAIGQRAGGLWDSVKGAASGLGSRIANSGVGQAVAGSKFGQAAGRIGQGAGDWMSRAGSTVSGWADSGVDAARGLGSRIAGSSVGQTVAEKGGKALGVLDNLSAKGAKALGGEAIEQGGKALAKTGGKAAGRFVPGMNVAIAGLDAKHAWDTFNDPNAPTHKKATAAITALGSGLAATNIPIVSQIGAGVSTVSSLVEAAGGPQAVANGAKWAGGKVADGAKWAGGKAMQGAQWAGGKIADGAAAAKDFGGRAWNGAKAGASSLWEGGKNLASGAKDKIGGLASSVGGGLKKLTSGW